MSYQARRSDGSYRQTSNENNANNIRNAADVAIAAKNPYGVAAGTTLKAADKLTGGKASDGLGKMLTKANQIAPGGQNLQDALNQLNESGIGDKIGQAAVVHNNLNNNQNNGQTGRNGNSKNQSGYNNSDNNNENEDFDGEGTGVGSAIMKKVAVIGMIAATPIILLMLVFISITTVYANFEDGIGASSVSGDSIGEFELIEASSKEAQDFYTRINEVKNAYAIEGKYFESIKIVAVYYVMSNESSWITYDRMTKQKIEEIADAMFNESKQYDETFFKENLKETVLKKWFRLSSDKKREEMANDVIKYINDYYEFVGVGPDAGSISSGPYKSWKQYKGQWINISLGNSYETIRSAGCAAVSVSILIAKSAVPTTVELNPGTFVQKMSANGGFDSNGCIAWARASSVAPTFKYVSMTSVSGKSKDEKLNKLRELLNNGYYVVAEVKGNTGQHWVAVDAIQGNDIIMMDPGSNATNMWNQYGWQNTSRFVYYTVQGS